jgi:hypothetical protein
VAKESRSEAKIGKESAHHAGLNARLLPTSMRETRFSLAYSHPYDMNLMTGRQV